MRVCYFGTYDTDHSRNRVIIKGLRQNGVEVLECHARLWRGTSDKIHSMTGGTCRPRLLYRILASYLCLIKRYAKMGGYDVMVVGYAGHLDLFLGKLLTFLSVKPLVFDALLSLTETVVEDRELVPRDSTLAKLLYLVDKYSCQLADLVLLDTNVHFRYFHEAFGVNMTKLRRLYAGADDAWYHPSSHAPSCQYFRVVYFGQYIPLHGVKYIIEAAKLLEGQPDIAFELVGVGQTYEEVLSLARRLAVRNVTFYPTWLSPQALAADHIAGADVCLGIFGDGRKARRVVPLKVFAAMAMGKAVITGDSPAAREVLVSGQDVLLCEMGDPQAIAQAILLLRDDQGLRRRIADGACRSFRQKFCPRAIGALMKGYLAELIATRGTLEQKKKGH